MAGPFPAIRVFVLRDIEDVVAALAEPTGPARSGRPDDRLRDAVLRMAMRGHDDSIKSHRAPQGEAVKRSLSRADVTRRRSGRPLSGVLPIIGVIFGLGLLAGAIVHPPAGTDPFATAARERGAFS